MPGKHQRSKQRFQDLCWKVHDCAQSFVFRSFTMHELLNENVALVGSSVATSNNQLMCFVQGQGQKENKNIQQRNLSAFITFLLY